MTHYHEVSPSHVHHSSELQASLDEVVGLAELAEAEEPAAGAAVAEVVEDNMADPEEGREGMTAQKMLVRLELMK